MVPISRAHGEERVLYSDHLVLGRPLGHEKNRGRMGFAGGHMHADVHAII